jgi:hypothetical protein
MDATLGSPDDERLAQCSSLQHVDADARAAVVMEACVPRLPPGVEPRLRVLVAPEELGRPRAATVEGVQLDPLRRGAGESHAFLGSEVVIRGLRCFDALELGHGLVLSGFGDRASTLLQPLRPSNAFHESATTTQSGDSATTGRRRRALRRFS